jgi:hypothetical protein
VPRLDIRTSIASTEYAHIHIYHEDVHIGDYEKSSDTHAERKRREIHKSADFLTDTFSKCGKFVVRWNGQDKEIRRYQEGQADPGRGAPFLDVLPRRYWQN